MTHGGAPLQRLGRAALVGLLVGLPLAGCDSETLLPESAVCVSFETPPLQDGGHLIGDQQPPVPYSSTPATSGWHAAGPPATGVHEEPLTDPQIVTVLHEGGVVATYDPSALDDDAVAQLEELGRQVENLTVTPYAGDQPTAVTLLSWGVLQRCTDVDPNAVRAFVERHAGLVGSH